MVINNELVKRKLAQLVNYLSELKRGKPPSFLAFQQEIRDKRNIERVLELLVETAVDLNNHILVESNQIAPTSYKTSFTDLVKLKILDPDFAEKISASAGLRNRLVHDYEDINDKIIYNAIDLALDQFTEYIHNINNFINKRPL